MEVGWEFEEGVRRVNLRLGDRRDGSEDSLVGSEEGLEVGFIEGGLV